MFRALPPDLIADLLPQVQERTYQPETTIIRQGEPVIEQGEVDFIDERNGGRKMRTLYDHDVFGEMALLTGELRSATAVAVKETRVWSILKEQFDRLLRASPELARAVQSVATQRGAVLQSDAAEDRRRTAAWVHAATADLDNRLAAPTNTEVREAAASHAGAPLAIWLGILLDGIPESLVIGSSLLQAPISALADRGIVPVELPRGTLQLGGNDPPALFADADPPSVDVPDAYDGRGGVFRSDPLPGDDALMVRSRGGRRRGRDADHDLGDDATRSRTLGWGGHGGLDLLGFLAAIFFKTFE